MSKVAIVTGANKGLGFALIKGLCEEFDGTVYLTSRDEIRGQRAVEGLNKLGYKPQFHQLDVTNKASIITFCDYLRKKHGKVDLLINNAGIFLEETDITKIEKAEQSVEVNFTALVNFCEDILPLLENGGRIVNISSSSGHLSRLPSEELRKKYSSIDLNLEDLNILMANYVEAVRRNMNDEEGWGTAYVMSKIGVNAYTFLLQRRLSSRGIHVNCVHPGYVISDMRNGQGTLHPDEAAVVPVKLALQSVSGGLFVWSDGTPVPWDGPDPRGYRDGKKL